MKNAKYFFIAILLAIITFSCTEQSIYDDDQTTLEHYATGEEEDGTGKNGDSEPVPTIP
ncbi:hypothetical protein [Mangrovimonas sp. YM274]|uniref:hypothetical protein n=1 Tax=Mangrovimonas sp. YM274 TaxID=3070660 RepID=UPI0027DB1EC0|nr:hypothetical protein [Mangrovimonas sp. YM274]WMI68164.1 hypothetical protein RBH95_13545 [Mangrovimonas sp. YM274]